MNLLPIKALGRFTGNTHKLCKSIQLLDNALAPDSRSILMSQQKFILENFQLNQKYTFNSISVKPQGKQPFYQLIIILGTVSDFSFKPAIKDHIPVSNCGALLNVYSSTD